MSDFKNQIRRLTAEKYWQKLVECGWIAEIPESERLSLRSRLESVFSRNDPIGIFYVFYALAAVYFDAECIEGTGPGKFSYHYVIDLLAENSFGQFNPKNIVDEIDDEKKVARISFQHGGRRFSCKVPWLSDWFDVKVIGLVNKALESSGTSASFIQLPACDQMIYLALISERTYQKAVESGLIPAGDTFSHDN